MWSRFICMSVFRGVKTGRLIMDSWSIHRGQGSKIVGTSGRLSCYVLLQSNEKITQSLWLLLQNLNIVSSRIRNSNQYVVYIKVIARVARDLWKCKQTLSSGFALLILPKRSLIECRQCNVERKIKKLREDAAQKGIKVKASWGP